MGSGWLVTKTFYAPVTSTFYGLVTSLFPQKTINIVDHHPLICPLTHS